MKANPANPTKNVRCFVRLKPPTSGLPFPSDLIDLTPTDPRAITLHLRRKSLTQTEPESHAFSFDSVLGITTTQTQLYDSCVSDLVTSSFDGYNSCVVCYGQTGAGKTFTTTGSSEYFEHRGVVPRAISQVFQTIRRREREREFEVRISYLEIYNESLGDLIGGVAVSSEEDSSSSSQGQGEELKILDDEEGGGVVVKGARRELVTDEEQALHWLFVGESARTISQHQLNLHSSRSHCVFTIHLSSRSRLESDDRLIRSKLHFVDLAGSERLSKSLPTSKTAIREALHINKSLTYLEQVIISLGGIKGGTTQHVPYRQSRLTNLLRDSLGGNCKTTLIANVWSDPQHLEETLSTLRFASRMSLVTNQAVPNVELSSEERLRRCEKEVRDLKAELAMHDQIAGRSHVQYDAFTDEQQEALRRRIREFVEDGTIKDLEFANLRQMKEIVCQFKVVALDMRREAEDKSSASAAQSTSQGGEAASPGAALLAQAQAAGEKRVASAGSNKAASASLTSESSMSSAGGLSLLTTLNVAGQSGMRPTTSSSSLCPQTAGAESVRGKAPAPDEKASALTDPDQSAASSSTTSRARDKKSSRKKAAVDQAAASSSSKTPASSSHRRRHKDAVAATQAAATDPESVDQDPNASCSGVAQPDASQGGADSEKQQAVDDAKREDGGKTKETLEVPKDRNEAYELYKRERGKDLYSALEANKRALRERLSSQRVLATRINDVKRSIDNTRSLLQSKQDERMRTRPPQGDLDVVEGEVVDEEEFEAMKSLRLAKREYRERYEELLQSKPETQYLQKSIEQGRERLLSEFEEWFASATSSSSSEPLTEVTDLEVKAVIESTEGGGTLDAGERFDRAHQAKCKEMKERDPEAYAYFSALQQAAQTRATRKTPGSAVKSASARPPSFLPSVGNR